MAIIIFVGNWPDNIEVLALCHQDIQVEEWLVWDPRRRW